jgi:Tol biopolymer transport system component
LSVVTRGNSDSAFPKWSPDGKLIAFTSNSDGLTEIYVMKTDGTDQQQITRSDSTNPKNSYGVQWSPDGRYLGFISQGVQDVTSASVDLIRPDGFAQLSLA